MTDQPVPQPIASQEKNASQEHARHELHNQAGKSLFFINGAGAVALLTFLQAIWKRDSVADPIPTALIVGTIIGLILLCMGVTLAAISSYVRYLSSVEWQYTRQGSPGGKWHWRSYKIQFLSVSAFFFGTVAVSLGGISQLFGCCYAFQSVVVLIASIPGLYWYVTSPTTCPFGTRDPWQTTACFVAFRRKNGDLPYVLSLNVRVNLPNDDPVRTVSGVVTCWVRDANGGRTTVYQGNLDITAGPRFEKPQWLAQSQWFNKPRHFKRVASHVLRLDFDNFSNSHRILRDQLDRTIWEFAAVRIVYRDGKEERFRKDPVPELRSEN